MAGRTRWVAVLGVALVGTALALAPAAPAAAHDVGGVGATDFQTTLTALAPAVGGVDLRVIENGSRLELTNTTGTDVTVAGYAGEPYARVGPGGAFVNDNSPATYLNADRFSVTVVPARADPTKPPAWRQVDSRPLLRWHDHRIHWMLSTLPPAVAANPSVTHHISSWSVTLRYADRPLTATGSLDWVPGPAPWPWLAATAIMVTALVVVAWRPRPHRALAAAAAAMVVAQAVHGLGIAAAIAGTLPEKLGAVLGSDALLIWPLALVGAGLLARGHARAAWLTGAAGLFVAVSLVVDDAPLWWRSSAPSGLPMTLNRAVLALGVGVGLGLAAAAVPMVGRHAAPVRAWGEPSTPGPAGDENPRVPTPRPVRAPEPAVPEPAATGDASPAGVGRRQLGGYLAVGALGAVAGAAATALFPPASPPPPAPVGPALGEVGARLVAFHGRNQAGIAAPAQPQAQAWVAGFDVLPGTGLDELSGLLRRWTAAARRLTTNQPIGDSDDAVVAGLGASALTITVGFGASLFGRAGVPASARPPALAALPAFAGERLDPTRSNGDLGVVVAADDPLVVAHAARVLSRLANGAARIRWQLSGFNPARGAGPDGATRRNLMGQLDGTNNPKPADPDFAARVFVADDDPAGWLRGGSFLVVRRIRMLLDEWDRTGRPEQERVIGRRRDTGGPLSGGTEFTPADYGARADGSLVIPADAHIRLAAPAFNDGAAMLRRGFSYRDGDESGLLFLAWQADPRRGFIPVQRRLVAADALRRFIRHETSALFAMPGGVSPDQYLGQSLVEG